MLKQTNYDVHVFGPDAYPMLANDQRPWLCINQVPVKTSLNSVDFGIQEIHTGEIEGIHRFRKGPNPSTLIKFLAKNDQEAEKLINQHVTIDGKQGYTIRKYINK
jgi:hypothetical protein